MAQAKYVRLRDGLHTGVLVDVESGWGISGMDVKPFPEDDPVAASFVSGRVAAGVLEGASKAEYDEVTGSNDALLEAVGGDTVRVELARPHQEHVIQSLADSGRKATAERMAAGEQLALEAEAERLEAEAQAKRDRAEIAKRDAKEQREATRKQVKSSGSSGDES